eukprot:6458322-Amphidinium_carterae.3
MRSCLISVWRCLLKGALSPSFVKLEGSQSPRGCCAPNSLRDQSLVCHKKHPKECLHYLGIWFWYVAFASHAHLPLFSSLRRISSVCFEARNAHIVLDNSSNSCRPSSACMLDLCGAQIPEASLIAQQTQQGCRKSSGTIVANFLERSSASNDEAVWLALSPDAQLV